MIGRRVGCCAGSTTKATPPKKSSARGRDTHQPERSRSWRRSTRPCPIVQRPYTATAVPNINAPGTDALVVPPGPSAAMMLPITYEILPGSRYLSRKRFLFARLVFKAPDGSGLFGSGIDGLAPDVCEGPGGLRLSSTFKGRLHSVQASASPGKLAPQWTQSTSCATGRPQCGQASARVETLPSQSGHVTSAISNNVIAARSTCERGPNVTGSALLRKRWFSPDISPPQGPVLRLISTFSREGPRLALRAP